MLINVTFFHFSPKLGVLITSYILDGSILNNVTSEKDLDVVNTGDLGPSRQCTAADVRVKVLGDIKRRFSSFCEEIMMNIYKQLVIAHLDYAFHSWCFWYEFEKFLL